ncbi:MAG: hypothetical protein HY787_18490 [Deltaproteobacteria bacterium]|nr:hypothetical protein [Deltaproteobacteria bacterium]
MQGKGKEEETVLGLDSGWKGPDGNTAATGVSLLHEMVKAVEADTPFSAVRQAYAASLDTLVELAGRERDVNLLARYHAIISLLETEDGTPGKKDHLIAQVNQANKMLQGRSGLSKPVTPGLIAGDQTTTRPKPPPPSDRFCEEILRSFPSIGEQEIKLLKDRDLLEEERLLNLDALELARMAGLTPHIAFEVKDLLRQSLEQRAKQDIARRVVELKRINGYLNADCDRMGAANQTLLMNNKNLKNQYPLISEQANLEANKYKALQSQVVSARIETNRLSTEINFLKEEHQKLLDLVEEKHLAVDDLFKRFTDIRSSFEFVLGETSFAQDLMANVESLLNKALSQKKTLNRKIASCEESMEKLFSEFNEIIKKGKTDFYRSL